MSLIARTDRMFGTCALLFVVGILSACARAAPAVAETPVPAVQPGGACHAADVQFVMGKTVDERLAEQARRRAGARVVRVLRPGQMATLEFNPSRLNLRADQQGMVTAADCG